MCENRAYRGGIQSFTDEIAACKRAMDALFAKVSTEMDNSIPMASEAAPETVKRWGSRSSEGGLHFMTYRAVCRRDGVFAESSTGPKNFNMDLFEPIYKNAASVWEMTFNFRLPPVVDEYVQKTELALDIFHNQAVREAATNDENNRTIEVLAQQLRANKRRAHAFATELKTMWTDGQRTANRMFTRPIEKAMARPYSECCDQSGESIAVSKTSEAYYLLKYYLGPGMYMRMKNIMAEHVAANDSAMFHEACAATNFNLENIATAIEQKMLEFANESFDKIRQDYTRAFCGDNTTFANGAPNEVHTAWEDIEKSLYTFDESFERLMSAPAPKRPVIRATLEEHVEQDDDFAQESDEEDDDSMDVDEY